MEKILKIKTIKKKLRQNKILKPKKDLKLKSESVTNNIDKVIDEFLSSFEDQKDETLQSNISLPPKDKVTPQPIISIIDESLYDEVETSNGYDTNLLLAYNYILSSKTVLAVGFAPHIDFNSVATLRQNNGEIVFDLFLWKKVIRSAEVIEQAFMFKTSTTEMPFLEKDLIEIKDPINIHSNVKICFTVDRQFHGKIIFYQNNSKIIIDFKTWRKLLLLEYLIESILYNNKFLEQNVKNYYNQYIERCFVKKFTFLLKNDLMCPTLKSHNLWSYERLFHELPVLCKKKMQLDIDLLIKNKKVNF